MTQTLKAMLAVGAAILFLWALIIGAVVAIAQVKPSGEHSMLTANCFTPESYRPTLEGWVLLFQSVPDNMNHILQVWISPDGKTWEISSINSNGNHCYWLKGGDHELLPAPPDSPPVGEPS